MKQNLTALKLYIVGLAIGLFVFGWALIARAEAALIATQESASSRIIEIAPGDSRDGQGLTALPDLPAIPTLPPIRTRVS